MMEQVKAAAGIHMSTFKEKATTSTPMKEDDAPQDADGSDWEPDPSFWLQMKKAGA